MGEIARSLDLVERRNGRRFLATYTEKGFVIVASGIGKFRVPDKRELKPQIIGIG